jgi:hypothetical protein
MNYSVREIDSTIGFLNILNIKLKSDSSLQLTEKLELKGSYLTSAFDLSGVIRFFLNLIHGQQDYKERRELQI